MLSRVTSHVLGIAFGAVLLLASGCRGPVGKTSRYMSSPELPPRVVPEGKALVFVHRPRESTGAHNYANIWDGTKLIADLGNGHTVYYECEPGEHYFVARAPEHTSVIKADLEAGRIYDAYVKPAWSTWTNSFMMHPINRDDEIQAAVESWLASGVMYRWAERTQAVEAYESKNRGNVQAIMAGWKEGDSYIGPKDHRAVATPAEEQCQPVRVASSTSQASH